MANVAITGQRNIGLSDVTDVTENTKMTRGMDNPVHSFTDDTLHLSDITVSYFLSTMAKTFC